MQFNLTGKARMKRRQAFSAVLLQALILVIIAFYLLVDNQIEASYSLLIGGLVSLLPQIFFISRFFVEVSPRAAKRIIKRFYRAEVLKFLMIALLFIAAVQWMSISITPFIIGIVIAQMAVLLTPFAIIIRQKLFEQRVIS